MMDDGGTIVSFVLKLIKTGWMAHSLFIQDIILSLLINQSSNTKRAHPLRSVDIEMNKFV